MNTNYKPLTSQPDQACGVFTLLIQGRLTKETYEFYTKHYSHLPIIISTWARTKLSLQIHDIPENVVWIESVDPGVNTNQNFLRQLESTLNGLQYVQTEYVIKVRGDEYYSNLQSVIDKQLQLPDKLIVLPIFFRPWNWFNFQYHLSDHLMSCNTEVLYKTFNQSLQYYTINSNTPKGPEVILGENYTQTKHNGKMSKELFKNSIYIHSLVPLKPYKVMYNGHNKIFYDNFNPKENNSIEDINEL
jgi:hypothetical protein